MTGGGSRRSARSRVKTSGDGDRDESSSRRTRPDFNPRRDRGRNHNSIRIFNVDLKLMLGFSVIAFFIILFVIHGLIKPAEESQRPRVVTPFPAPKVTDLPQVKILPYIFFFLNYLVCVFAFSCSG